MGKKNPIVHVEFRTKDKGRLQAFYSALFSWKFKDFGADYTVIDTGAKEGGAGMMQLHEGQPIPTGVASFIHVDDLAPYEEKIRAIGGQVFMSNQEVPGMGHFSVFADVDGNQMGLWKTSPKPKKKDAKRAEKAAKKAAKRAQKAAKKNAKKSSKK